MPEEESREQSQKTTKLVPSPALAWIIGTLSGKGTVNTKTGEILFGFRNEQVQQECVSLGQQVFGVGIPLRPFTSTLRGVSNRYLVPNFFNTGIARQLGGLSRAEFPETIKDKHPWILEDPVHTQRYVEGLFEARGNIYKRAEGASRDIIFQTSFPFVSEFIADVLTKIGVTPTIIKMRMGTQMRTKGVTISTLPEQKKFAQLIHSKDPEKEAMLKDFREDSLDRVQMRVKSKDQLVQEWERMRTQLGHHPNSNEINDLWKQGKTVWTHETYTYWFGETEVGKKFSEARKQLISVTEPELIKAQLEALAKRQQRKARIGQKTVIRQERQERLKQKQEEAERALQPSRELAWVLALLASGGNISLKTGSMALMSPNQDLQNAYINIAGNLFRTNTTWQTLKSSSGERRVPQFNNTAIARQIGDLRRVIWPQTITEKHSWILEDPNFTWAFLSGIYDDKGIFSRDGTQLAFPTVFNNIASFISDLLVRVDIENPYIIKHSSCREGVQAVAIGNIRDLRRFADYIHSAIPAKEQILDSIRSDTARKPRDQAPLDESEMVAEWRRLYDLLGHPPNSTDITELHVEGRTRWSVGVYARVFGSPTGTNEGRSYETALSRIATVCGIDAESIRYRRPDQKYKHIKDLSELVVQYRKLRDKSIREKGGLPSTSDFDRARKDGLVAYSRVTFANYFGEGSLVEALSRLEGLILVQDINLELGELQQRTGFEVKFVPKTHPIYSAEAAEKLDEILTRPDNLSNLPFLYGPYGERLYMSTSN